MVLKLSGHVRNTISLLYKQKTGWNSDIWNFFSEKIDFFFNFGLFSLKIRFLSPAMFENVIVMSYIDRFSWFWYQWKEETQYPIPWNQTIILWPYQFQVHKGDCHHPPLVNHVTKKRLGGTRVNWHQDLSCPDKAPTSLFDTQQNSYSISHLLGTVTTWWLDSDGVIKAVNCWEHRGLHSWSNV